MAAPTVINIPAPGDAPTPCMACLQATGDNTTAPGTATVANATLLAAAAVEGPLRTLLAAPCADQATARARLLYGNPVVVSVLPRFGGGAGAFVDANVAGGVAVLEFTDGATGNPVHILRMEYRHSVIN